ncbi:MAG: hypothetical protein EOO02_23415 [Chitinophagaceae bacterium]|nr:MAG: hypothetical protein EOO02_23415 [Chitinophagaceae bacterium]
MKQRLLFAMMTLLFTVPVFSQAYESQVTYDKKKQKAISIDYAYSQEAVQNAIVQKIEKMGFIGKEEKGVFNKDKGYIIFKDAAITDVSEERMDYIIKVDRKSRKDKDETTLYFLIQKNGEDAIQNTLSANDIGQAKAFLYNLLPEIEEANLEIQIKSQDEAVVKSEKKFKDLQDQKADLEKKLQKNAEDIENQQKQIETQRAALDGLKGKRKTAM